MQSSAHALTVLLPEEGESWSAFARRAKAQSGELLLVLSGPDESLAHSAEELEDFLQACTGFAARVRLATRKRTVVIAARKRGLRVIDRTTDLRKQLQGHSQLESALRVFAPSLWQQQLRSRLQTIGLLSLPRLRVYVLILISAGLFAFVLFWLLPSASIRIEPREEPVSQTANIFLVQSGATLNRSNRVRTLLLRPIRVKVDHSLTFDQISKEFIGQRAQTDMTITNASAESYSLRSDTRVMNQAGMIFRLQDPVNVAPGEEVTVRAVADDTDLYGEIIGERGNVPAGLRWDFPGLAPQERLVVYAENRAAATGGHTSYRTVLHEADLTIAQKRLEQELLSRARQLVDEELTLFNSRNDDAHLTLLEYEELTSTVFHDIVLPRDFLGEPVTSVPVSGSVTYTAYAYDSRRVLDMLRTELREHVGNGRRLLEESVTMERLVSHVIDYADDLSWIKLTVDLSGTEQYILDPLSPNGARFARTVRELVTGIRTEDALRIVRNLPEVSNVHVAVWPPWSRMLPRIPSHISIESVARSSE